MSNPIYEDDDDELYGGFCPVCRNSRCYAGGNHVFEQQPVLSGWHIEEEDEPVDDPKE